MLAIIQARMSSQRFPGKVLKPLSGRPMLAWVIARVSAAQMLTRTIVATSTHASDDPVEKFCACESVPCFRGSLSNVAERFAQAAEAEGVDAFVRLNGDSPLIDASIIDRAITLYQSGECDLVSNVLVRSFPRGQSVEVLRRDTFDKVCRILVDPMEREHVTRHYYANPQAFRIVNFTSGADARDVQLSIDTHADFDAAARLISQSKGVPGGWRDLMNLTRASIA